MKLAFEFTKHVPWAVHKLFHVTVDQFTTGANGAEQRIGGQDFSIRNLKTATDTMQGGVPTTGPGHLNLCWWIVIALLVIILILIYLLWRKIKT